MAFDINKSEYTFDDLVEVVKILRSPGGCPWDAEQTNQSIKQALVEETYEVLEALMLENDEKLSEELGDVLLQVVFHSQIASETDRFNVEDVTTKICRKLIHRHPHVFGELSNDLSARQVLSNWEDIKKKEKGLKSQTQVLVDVPNNLPALIRANKLQQKAAKVGFDWDNITPVFDKVAEEMGELKQAFENKDTENINEELGDLLFSVVNLARHLHVQPEMALTSTSEKFIKRFEYIEKSAMQQGKRLEDMTLGELDALWQQAKI